MHLPSPFLYPPPFVQSVRSFCLPIQIQNSASNLHQAAQIPPAPTPPPLVAPTPAIDHLPQMPIPPRPPGYVYVPRAYPPAQSGVQPAIGEYSVGWQYTIPVPPPPNATAAAPRGPFPPPDVKAGEGVGAKVKEHYYHYEYEKQEAAPSPPPPKAPAAPPPILFCHVCSECGQMRSNRFHRQNPIIPSKPLVTSACRRCKKKSKRKEKERCVRKSIHVRTCRAEEPCDWPDGPIHIEIGGRGRSRRSHSVGVYFDPPDSPPQIVRRSSSRTNLGLRVLQDSSPPRILRGGDPHRGEYRGRSVSPARIRVRDERRDAEDRLAAHPMPYRVLPDQRAFLRESDGSSTAPRPRYEYPQSPTRGILKPSGNNRETSYRHEMSMHASQDSTMVEVGGPKVQFSTESDRRAERIMADRNREQSRRYAIDGHTSSEDYDYFHRSERAQYQIEDPPTSPPITSFENLRIRHSSPTGSYEEVRIRHHSPPPRRSEDDRICPRSPPPRHIEDVRVCQRSPVRVYEEVRIRQHSPARNYEEVHVRHVSPHKRGYEEVRIRYASPPPRKPSDEVRIRYTSPPRRISDEVRIRHVSPRPRGRSPQRAIGRDSPRPKEKEKDWDQVTATDSDNSGELVDVRSWRGVYERGQPATYVEERRTVRLLEGEKVDEHRHVFSPERPHEYGPERRDYAPERPGYAREYAPPAGSWREV